MRVSEQQVNEASRQVDAARSEAVAAGQERSAALTDAFNRGVGKLSSASASSGRTSSEYEQLGKAVNRIDQLSRSVAESTGLSQSQVASIAFGAAMQTGGRLGAVGGKLHGSADKSYQAGLSAQEQKVLSSLSSEQLSEFRQFGERMSRDRSLVNSVASDAREANELAARLSSASSKSERAEASLAGRQAYAQRLSGAIERGETISIDIAQDPHNLAMFTRYAEQYGGDSAAARVLMEAELGRQALRPTPKLPAGFDDVRRGYGDTVKVDSPGRDVERQHQEAVEQVRRATMNSPVIQAPAMGQPGTRSEVDALGRKFRGDVANRERGFDDATEITKDENGTVGTGRSLGGRVGRQLLGDGKSTLGDLKDLAGRLVGRK